MNSQEIMSYCAHEYLKDRRPVTVRAMRADDKQLIKEALDDVDAESLYRRLFGMKKGSSDYDLKRLTEVDFSNVVALVAVEKKDGVERIIGGGRYVRTGPSDTGEKAAVAFLVDDTFHGLGVGSCLLKHLAVIARASGITHFEAGVLPSNKPMLRVFSRSGFPLTTTIPDRYIHVVMELVEQPGRGASCAAYPADSTRQGDKQ